MATASISSYVVDGKVEQHKKVFDSQIVDADVAAKIKKLQIKKLQSPGTMFVSITDGDGNITGWKGGSPDTVEYHLIRPGTKGVDPRDVLYALQRAKNRLHKNGWSHGMAVQEDGRICLGTALGMFMGHPMLDAYFDNSVGARAAAGRVTHQLGDSIPHWNDHTVSSIHHVQRVLDKVINATIDELARSV